MMRDKEFESMVNAELARRFGLFRKWSAIVPRANRDRKDLSWYLNKRNRPKVSVWQDVRDLTIAESGYLNYADWLGQQASTDGDSDYQPYVANPDQCREDDSVWNTSNGYSPEQVSAAQNILNNLSDILTENERKVWDLSQNHNLGPSEIGEIRHTSHAAVSQMLKRIQGKLKKAYARQQAAQEKGTSSEN